MEFEVPPKTCYNAYIIHSHVSMGFAMGETKRTTVVKKDKKPHDRKTLL